MNWIEYGEYAVGGTAFILLVIHLAGIIYEEYKRTVERIREKKNSESMDL